MPPTLLAFALAVRLSSRMSLPRFSRAMSVFPAKAGIYVTPNRNPLEGPGGNQTSPKNHSNQTNHSSRPSAPHQSPHNHPTRLSAETRNPRPLATFRIPTSRRRRHSPHPSFRRKPEPTHPPTTTPSKVRAATKPVPKITQIKRITAQDQAPPPATKQRPHPSFQRNPEPTPPPHFRIPTSRRRRHAPHPSFRRKPESTSPPTATPSKVRTATKPVPKITQIKRITVQDQAPPQQPPRHAPQPSFRRNPEPTPLPTFRIPTSRRRRHAPHPSFRRKPESTSPPTATPSKVRTATNQSQKSLKSNESQFKTKRPPPATTHHPHPSFRRKPDSNSALRPPNSEFPN